MDEGIILEKVKRRFSIQHSEQDDVIRDLVEDAVNHFKLITGAKEVKDIYGFIIKDVVAIRYNRLSSYGVKSESFGGDYSVSYTDPKEDFSQYFELLNEEYGFLDKASKGWVMFLP